MRTPPLKPLIITSLPVFASVSAAAALVWYFDAPKLAMPFVLGIIAGGLVDLDNRLTGRLKNIIVTVILFSLASLLPQMTLGTGLPFILTMTAMTFCFTLLGAIGLRYRTFAFGALAVATYTTLTYTPETFWLTNPVMILFGTLLYSTCTLFSRTGRYRKAWRPPMSRWAAISTPKPTFSTPTRRSGWATAKSIWRCATRA